MEEETAHPATHRQHPIPQHIGAFQFKLVGQFTLKQFGYMAVFGFLAWLVLASKLFFLIKFPIVAGLVTAGIGFAFIPVAGRSLDKMLFNFAKSIFTPTQRIWIKKGILPDYFKPEFGKPKITETGGKIQASRKVLEEYLAQFKPKVTPADLAELSFLSKLDFGLGGRLAAIPTQIPTPSQIISVRFQPTILASQPIPTLPPKTEPDITAKDTVKMSEPSLRPEPSEPRERVATVKIQQEPARQELAEKLVTPQQVSQIISSEVEKAVAKKIPKETPKGLAAKLPEQVAKELASQVAREVLAETSGVQQEVFERVTQTSKQVAKEVAREVASQVVAQIVKSTPKTAKKTAEKKPAEIAKTVVAQVTAKTENIARDVAKEVAKEVAKDVAERVLKEVSKTSKSVAQKEIQKPEDIQRRQVSEVNQKEETETETLAGITVAERKQQKQAVVPIASTVNFVERPVITIPTPGRPPTIMPTVGEVKVRKLRSQPALTGEFLVRGEKKFEISEELKTRLGLIPQKTPVPEVEEIKIEEVKKQKLEKPKQPEVEKKPEEIKESEIPKESKEEIADKTPKENGKTTQKPATATLSKTITPPPVTTPTQPNIIAGLVKDSAGHLLENVILIVKNENGAPVRALKTNLLGQFSISTPLSSGNFTIIAEKEGYKFSIMEFEAKGKIIEPFEILSQKQ